MEGQAKLLGHSIHPMLIVFPLRLLATAVAFDIVGLPQGDASWYRISFWMIAAGVIGGLCAAVFGGELVDRPGVGGDSNANVNAPSSLSKQPVAENRTDYRCAK